MTTQADIDICSLPQVDESARPPVQRRPRADGDVSELRDRACWPLQHLLTRRFISATMCSQRHRADHDQRGVHVAQRWTVGSQSSPDTTMKSLRPAARAAAAANSTQVRAYARLGL